MKTAPMLPIKECTGCSACVTVCPVKAIAMKADDEGFLRPFIDETGCVGCGKCEKTCPIAGEVTSEAQPLAVFAAKADRAVQTTSQSGGVFFALARSVLEQGGAVYGAALEDDFVTRHIRVEDAAQLHRLQGVKYVQSAPEDCYESTARDLKDGRVVLYSGTPCQIAGLCSALKGKNIATEKLLTVDLVCYGVPSPGVFRQWLRTLEKSRCSKVTAMQYRRVDAPWGEGKEYYRFADGTELEGSFYTGLYFRNLIIRPSCESCRFCNVHRPGDLTLGDFWGIENALPEFYDEKGVSLVLVNTPKGQAAFDRIAEALDHRSATLDAAVAAQPRLRNIAVKPSAYRDSFWQTLSRKGMDYVSMEQEFIAPSVAYRLRRRLEAVKKRLWK